MDDLVVNADISHSRLIINVSPFLQAVYPPKWRKSSFNPFCIAAFYGHFEYVRWKLGCLPELSRHASMSTTLVLFLNRNLRTDLSHDNSTTLQWCLSALLNNESLAGVHATSWVKIIHDFCRLQTSDKKLERDLRKWYLARIADAMNKWGPVCEPKQEAWTEKEHVAWQHYPRIPGDDQNSVEKRMSIVQFLGFDSNHKLFDDWELSSRFSIPLVLQILGESNDLPKQVTTEELDPDLGKLEEEWHERERPKPTAIRAMDPVAGDNTMSTSDHMLSGLEVGRENSKQMKSSCKIQGNSIGHNSSATILVIVGGSSTALYLCKRSSLNATGIICGVLAYWLCDLQLEHHF